MSKQKTYVRTPEHKALMSKIKRGHKVSQETREKIRKGHIGKELSKEHKTRIRQGQLEKLKIKPNAKYNAIHEWIRKRKQKPELCEKCKINKPYDLANLSGNYKRDVQDYLWLCRKCHYHLDRKK